MPISDRVETLNINYLFEAFAYLRDKDCIIRVEHQTESLISVDGKEFVKPEIKPEIKPVIVIQSNGRGVSHKKIDLRRKEYRHLRKNNANTVASSCEQ